MSVDKSKNHSTLLDDSDNAISSVLDGSTRRLAIDAKVDLLPHDLGGSSHSSDTVANLSAKVSDADLVHFLGALVDHEVVRADGTAGKVQGSDWRIDDSDSLYPNTADTDLLGLAANRIKRLFANHLVGGADVFASAQSLDDAQFVIAQNGTYTLTLPTAEEGWWYIIQRQGSTGTVTLAPGGGDTINGGSSVSLDDDSTYIVFAEDATDWRLVNITSGGFALSDSAPVDVTKAAASAGTGTAASRDDHKHDVSTAAPGATGVATASGEGSATSLARSDHTHQSNTAPSDVTKATAAIGTSGEPARADHKHDVSTATAGAATPGDSAAEGSATSLARSDHQHSLPAFGTGAGTFCEGNDGRLVTNGDSHDHNGGDGAQIDHTTLSNIGTNTHAQIDTHIAAASPHSGHATTSHASTHIRAGTDEIDGDKLDIDWDPTNYTPATTPTEVTHVDELTAHLYGIDQALGSMVTDDLAAVKARRTTQYTLTTSYADVTFDTTDVENDDTIVEHHDTFTQRITVKEAGLYWVSFAASFDFTHTATVSTHWFARVTLNGTAIEGSEVREGGRYSGSEADFIACAIEHGFPIELSASDYLVLQLKFERWFGTGGTATTLADVDPVFSVVRLQGTKGDKGDTGSGSSITVEEDGVSVTGTPHTELNFTSPLTATNVDGDQVDIGLVFGSLYQKAESLSESSTTGDLLFHQKLRLTTPSVPAGDYYVAWSYEWACDDQRRCQFQVQVDDTTTLMDNIDENTAKSGDGGYRAVGGHAIATLTAAIHNIDLDYGNEEDSGKIVYIRKARLTIWRVS